MDNQSTIEWLDHIMSLVERGNNKAALLALDKLKLKHCIMQSDCPAIPDNADYPAILREQAI